MDPYQAQAKLNRLQQQFDVDRFLKEFQVVREGEGLNEVEVFL